MTRANAARKAKDPTQLSFNPSQLKEVIVYLIKHKGRNDLCHCISLMSPDELSSTYNEVHIRNFLISDLVISGAGARQSAIVNMAVDEFLDPVIHEVARKFSRFFTPYRRINESVR